jgi:hypothetical protein
MVFQIMLGLGIALITKENPILNKQVNLLAGHIF